MRRILVWPVLVVCLCSACVVLGDDYPGGPRTIARQNREIQAAMAERQNRIDQENRQKNRPYTQRPAVAPSSNDLNYRLVESNRTIGYQIESNSLEYDIQVVAECSSTNKKYSLNFVEKGTNKDAHNPQWSFFYNGKRNYKSLTIYDEENYLKNIAHIQTARYLGSSKWSKKIELTSPKLNQLPRLCEKKYDNLVVAERNKAQQKRAKDKKLIDSVTEKTGLSPMLSGDNQTSFNELIYDFQRTGYTQHKNKFVWVTDGDYKVSQVLNGKVILTSYNSTLLPITIVTELPALEGQFWSNISRSPLKLIGATNYTTILGAQKQTIVFQQL